MLGLPHEQTTASRFIPRPSGSDDTHSHRHARKARNHFIRKKKKKKRDKEVPRDLGSQPGDPSTRFNKQGSSQANVQRQRNPRRGKGTHKNRACTIRVGVRHENKKIATSKGSALASASHRLLAPNNSQPVDRCRANYHSLVDFNRFGKAKMSDLHVPPAGDGAEDEPAVASGSQPAINTTRYVCMPCHGSFERAPSLCHRINQTRHQLVLLVL